MLSSLSNSAIFKPNKRNEIKGVWYTHNLKFLTKSACTDQAGIRWRPSCGPACALPGTWAQCLAFSSGECPSGSINWSSLEARLSFWLFGHMDYVLASAMLIAEQHSTASLMVPIPKQAVQPCNFMMRSALWSALALRRRRWLSSDVRSSEPMLGHDQEHRPVAL